MEPLKIGQEWICRPVFGRRPTTEAFFGSNTFLAIQKIICGEIFNCSELPNRKTSTILNEARSKYCTVHFYLFWNSCLYKQRWAFISFILGICHVGTLNISDKIDYHQNRSMANCQFLLCKVWKKPTVPWLLMISLENLQLS